LLTDLQKDKPAIRFFEKAAIIAFGVGIMTLAAKIQLPFWPVPMTLHTLAVMSFALILGPRLSTAIFAGYLAAGAAGIPVFSGSPERGVGLAYMIGPTGGYLLGYFAASWLVGALGNRKPLLHRCLACIAGLMVIYSAGLLGLWAFVPSEKLLAAGLAPFLVGDLVKCALAVLFTTIIPFSGKKSSGMQA
jgi:biotin transport system substrate-specific component